MSRNSGGTYSLPAGNPVVTGTLISSAWANTTLNDLATAMTDSLSRSGDGGMLAPLQSVDGAIGAPGYTFGNETTAGLYRAGAADFRFAIGGVDILTMTAAGAAFSTLLLADGAAATPSLAFASDLDTGFYRVGANSIGITAGGVRKATFNSGASALQLFSNDATGDVWVGFYESNDTATRKGYFGYGNAGDDVFFITQEKNAAINFQTNGTERGTISGSGAWTINAVASGASLTVNANAANYAALISGTSAQIIGVQLTNTTTPYSWAVGINRSVANNFEVVDLTAAATWFRITTAGVTNIFDGVAGLRPAGFREVLVGSTWTGTLTLTAADSGSMRRFVGTTGTLEVPQFTAAQAGMTVTIIHNGSGAVAINKTVTGVLRWQTGSTFTDGNRTLAVGGVCTIMYLDSDNACIWGNGLS